MQSLTESAIRAAFVNCSKGEASNVVVPSLADIEWDDLDFYAWRNPRMPQRTYLTAPHQGRLVSVVFRTAAGRNAAGAMRSVMCDFCHTVHSAGGVSLFTAAKAGALGRRGDSVGRYFCSDLNCSLYVREKKRPIRVQPAITATADERISRLNEALDGLLSRVLSPDR